MIEAAHYTAEVLIAVWPVALLIAMALVPVLWILFEETSEYDSIDKYYSGEPIDREELKNKL